MIPGLTCRHCLKTCQEGWRGMVCRDFRENWRAIIEDDDPRISKMGKAEYKRIRKRIRKEINGESAV